MLIMTAVIIFICG